MEKVINGEMAYLDVIPKFSDGKVGTRWYHKGYASRRTFDLSSAYQKVQTISAAQDLTHRIIRVSDQDTIDDGIRNAFRIFEEIGFPSGMISGSVIRMLAKVNEERTKKEEEYL